MVFSPLSLNGSSCRRREGLSAVVAVPKRARLRPQDVVASRRRRACTADAAAPVRHRRLNIPRALAEVERELIRERTVAGLKAARARGRKGGSWQPYIDHCPRVLSLAGSILISP
jgi:hypothetical protein